MSLLLETLLSARMTTPPLPAETLSSPVNVTVEEPVRLVVLSAPKPLTAPPPAACRVLCGLPAKSSEKLFEAVIATALAAMLLLVGSNVSLLMIVTPEPSVIATVELASLSMTEPLAPTADAFNASSSAA